MDTKELQETPIWELYQKSVNFMERRHIYRDTDVNHRMYNGDQNYGIKIQSIEPISHNFIKQVVKQKVSTITSNLFGINYSPENIENSEFMETAQKTCDLLNKKASKVMDKDFMDKKIKKWAKQAAINDEAVAYVTYDFEENMPVNEIISKNDIMYGDENEEEIQLQPYILVRQRKTITQLEEMARKEQIDEKLIKEAITDNNTSTVAGDSGKDEIEDKAWLITMFYRKNGMIHYSQATQYCEIKKDKNMGLTLYPVAHFNWEDQEGNARGVGEVRNLIPNQLEANKTAMRRALVTKNISYPQRVINEDSIQNIQDVEKIGATIKFKDMGNTRASDVFMTTSPGQLGIDSEKLQNELITLSKDLNNAGDMVTGNINPEQASGKAILAVQNVQTQPLNEQVIGLKSFIEDIARIWFEMWKVYSKNGLTIEVEEVDAINGQTNLRIETIPNYIMETLKTSVKVDITPKGAFDKYAQELSMENLFVQGKITFEEYIEALEPDSVMPKSKLEVILKKRKEREKQINMYEKQALQMRNQTQMRMAASNDIENINQMGNQLINQATA